MLIQIENMTKQYKNGRGVNDISLTMRKGDVLGLLGPNGSGKTTTMKVLSGLLTPDSGMVKMFGLDVLKDGASIRDKLGCMIENPGLYGYLTAEQNLQMVANLYPNIGADAVENAIKRAELSDRRKEKVSGFSMGMKQRLSFAMALLTNPELLILDEPTNGMDISGTAAVRETLKSMAESGHSILISSHLSHEIELLCNRVAVMEQGRILDTSTITDIRKNHGSVEAYYLSLVNTGKEIAS